MASAPSERGSERERGSGRSAALAERLLTLGAWAVIAAGVIMRLAALGAQPYGLYNDEADDGLDALSVLHGAHPLYFAADNGREPLFIYLMAVTIRLFGRTPLGVRAAAAICGLLTLLAAYLLGRTWGNRRVGLLTAALLAATLWHVHLSRVGFRAVVLPLFLALALALGARALGTHSRKLLVATGVLYGLSFYTYLSVRFTPLALLAMGAYGLIWHGDRVRRRWREGAWMAGAALLTVLPLAIYALLHPDIVFLRSSEVAIWNAGIHGGHPLSALTHGALSALAMFTWRGDANWRHNVPHRPIFDPLLSALFLGAIALTLRGWRQRPAWALSLIWSAVMTLPTVLSDQPPHFLRAVGVLPVVLLLPALTLDEALRWWSGRRVDERMATNGAGRRGFRASPVRELVLPLGTLLLLAASTTLSARDYFGHRSRPALPLSGFDYVGSYLTDPVRGYYFFAPGTDLAREVNAAPGTVYLDRMYWNILSALRFQVTTPERVVFYEAGTALAPGKLPLTLVASPREGMAGTLALLPPAAEITVAPGPEMVVVGSGERIPHLYVRWTAAALPDDVRHAAPLARFASDLQLAGAQASMAGRELNVRLRWSKSGPSVPPAQLSLEALDATGAVVARSGDMVGTAFYPPPQWTAGSVVVQQATLALPEKPPAPRRLRLTVRDPRSGRETPIAACTIDRQGDALILPIRG